MVQRVSEASVHSESKVLGSIGNGLAILVGLKIGDSNSDADELARKVIGLRIFDDGQGKMNLASTDVNAGFLVVSQFTLYADTSRGRRPSFVESAPPDVARAVYDRFVERLRETGAAVETGVFGAEMQMRLVNDGPVTILLDSGSRL